MTFIYFRYALNSLLGINKIIVFLILITWVVKHGNKRALSAYDILICVTWQLGRYWSACTPVSSDLNSCFSIGTQWPIYFLSCRPLACREGYNPVTWMDLHYRYPWRAWHALIIQSNFNGSNTFGTMKICPRQGEFEPLRVYHRTRSGGINKYIFSIFVNMRVYCVYSLESPQGGDSIKYTQYTIARYIKEIHPKLSHICKNEVEPAVVNEPSVFESLKFYCYYLLGRHMAPGDVMPT